MADFLLWWLAAEAAGVPGLLLAAAALRSLPDRGIAFAKPLGLLLTGYVLWLLASGPVPNGRPAVLLALAVAAVAGGAALLRAGRPTLAGLRARLPYLLALEAVFLAALAGAAFLRSYVPEIAGTEKPMDLAFLNAAVRGDGFPPPDPWLAGHTVSYYYFGYLLLGALTTLTGLPTAVTFNLGLALVFALAAVAAVGVGYNMAALSRPRDAAPPRRAAGGLPRGPLAVGLAAAGLLLVAGSMEGVLEWLAAQGYGSAHLWERVGIEGLTGAQRTDTWYPTEFWWWWRATRVVPGIIHEFPFFSFLLGDLHPHVMAIPFVLLAAGVAVALWRRPGEATLREAAAEPAPYLLAAAVFGGLAFLNTWDFPAGLAVLTGSLLLRNLRERWAPGAALAALAVAAAVALASVLLYLPFYLHFDSQAAGFALVRGAATGPLGGLLHWAPLLLPVAGLAAYGLATGRWPEADRSWMAALAALLAAAPAGLWALLLLADGGLAGAAAARGWAWATDLALTGLLFALVFALLGHVKGGDGAPPAGPAPALLLGAVGVLLVLGPEFFYVQDVFRSRMNTVFKLWYHGWVLLAAAGAYGGFVLLTEGRRLPRPGRAAAALAGGASLLAVAAGLVYPVTATFARTDGFAGPRTLDGLAFVRASAPDEAAALAWLSGLAGTPVVLEAAGPDWGETGRVASRTGLPTVLGWPGHELQWRGSDELFRGRDLDVHRAYQTEDVAEAQAILRRYGVAYVYVGPVERRQYPAAGLAKFERFLEPVFRQGDVVIYRVPQDGARAEEVGAGP